MCGLAGIAGRNLDQKQITMFKDLLYVASLRGPHSTGVASVKKDGIVLNKVTEDAAFFLDYFAQPKGYINREKQLALIGHCRWATVGKVTRSNAHPYDTGRFIAAHNGTLKDNEYFPKGDTRTDSELMFRDMNTRGIVPVLKNLHFWSAWAVSIWDKEHQRLHLGRNLDRPLFFGIQKDSATVAWASELRQLAFAAMGVGLEFEWYKCKADHLYTFDVGTMTHDEMFTVEKLPEKTNPYGPQSSFMEWEWDDTVRDFRPRGVRNTTNTTQTSTTSGQAEDKDEAPFSGGDRPRSAIKDLLDELVGK